MKLQPLISLDKFADVNHGVFSTEVPLIVTNGMGTEIRAYIMQSLIHEQQSNRIQIMPIYLNLTFHSNLWSSILWSWKVTFVSSKPNLCNALLPGSSVSFTSGVSPRIWPHPDAWIPLDQGERFRATFPKTTRVVAPKLSQPMKFWQQKKLLKEARSAKKCAYSPATLEENAWENLRMLDGCICFFNHLCRFVNNTFFGCQLWHLSICDTHITSGKKINL